MSFCLVVCLWELIVLTLVVDAWADLIKFNQSGLHNTPNEISP
ncbi:hypothetical protein MCRH_0257 [Moraxella catarrhalis RH4]|nr:hypothetical protein MCRH_0257 [Moraxella catarrhalis RH4]